MIFQVKNITFIREIVSVSDMPTRRQLVRFFPKKFGEVPPATNLDIDCITSLLSPSLL